ncbi:hypothetical protein MES5069_280040 [Mesorhizobium escarrei]|uniref:Uncharacterized protein n=1 Tax=Mesorhizobium escarrei TaxID=666018 RepID=A0ABN8JV13_9HYPH|nr:hypothetical protein MES5069_280040 [Mesorhizobium escarrei]
MNEKGPAETGPFYWPVSPRICVNANVMEPGGQQKP